MCIIYIIYNICICKYSAIGSCKSDSQAREWQKARLFKRKAQSGTSKEHVTFTSCMEIHVNRSTKAPNLKRFNQSTRSPRNCKYKGLDIFLHLLGSIKRQRQGRFGRCSWSCEGQRNQSLATSSSVWAKTPRLPPVWDDVGDDMPST